VRTGDVTDMSAILTEMAQIVPFLSVKDVILLL
jgi:hypothetical protein